MKKLLAILLAALLVIGCTAATVGAIDRTPVADTLKSLGLFTGSDKGYSLDRAPTRGEAITMLVRLLGADQEATAGTWQTPFTDVPSWAEPYVGYAYTNGITKGSSATTFGTETACSAKSFTTYVLRALGYSDAEGGDFAYNDAVAFAQDVGLISVSAVAAKEFQRSEAVEVMYNALFLSKKGSETILLRDLIAAGAVSESAAASLLAAYDLEVEALAAIDKALAAFDGKAIGFTGKAILEQSGTEVMNATAVATISADGETIQASATTSGYGAYIKDGWLYVSLPAVEGLSKADMTAKIDLEKVLGVAETVVGEDGNVTLTAGDTYGFAYSKKTDNGLTVYTVKYTDPLKLIVDTAAGTGAYTDTVGRVSAVDVTLSFSLNGDGSLKRIDVEASAKTVQGGTAKLTLGLAVDAAAKVTFPSDINGYSDVTSVVTGMLAQ